MGTFLDHVQVLGICPVGAFMVAESYFSEHSRVRNCPDTVDKQIRLICLHSWIDKLTSVQHKFQKSKIRPLRTNVYTSRFSTQNPKSCNTHNYLPFPHIRIAQSRFFELLGPWGGGENELINYSL